MSLILAIFIIVVLAGTLGVACGTRAGRKPIQLQPYAGGLDSGAASSLSSQASRYERQPYLLTQTELDFYSVLKEAVGDEYQIMYQVQLSQLIRVRSMDDPLEARAAFNQICRKHIDFVLCDPETLSVVAAIELDDQIHETKEWVLRNEFLNEVMECAGVTLLHFPLMADYSVDQIASKIAPLKQRSAA